MENYPESMKRFLGWTASLAVVVLLALTAALQQPPSFLVTWVAGEAFNKMLSQSVSHALKVDGQFGPLLLQPDWSVAAENFSSKGWPGQAIGALDTRQARGSFDVWGIVRGEWSVPLIQIAKTDFKLVNPDNALKADDPVVPPKPWYAFLMPSRFHCSWIDCPDTTIDLPFGEETVRGEAQHIGAMMIGKNFKYFGKGGRLLYPGYPAMAIDALEVYVTREAIDIGYLYLREPSSPRSNLQLALRLGQHADKSIKASAHIDALDIAPFLPSEVAKILSGRLNGTLDYATAASGGQVTGGGTVSLAGGELKNWEYLNGLAARAGQSSLAQIAIDEASVSYVMEGDMVRVDSLSVRADGSMTANGTGSWNTRTSDATLAVDVSGVPLGAYLPPRIAGSLRGTISGNLAWSWNGTAVATGSGGGTVRLRDTQLAGFRFQAFLDRFLKTQHYSEIELTAASCRWQQDQNGLLVDEIEVLAPGQAGLRGSLRIAPDGQMSGTILVGLPASSLQWLPEATTTVFARSEDGLHWCTMQVSGTEHKPETDFTAQVLRQLEKHPVAMAELAARGISWWLGDILHTRPAEKEG